MQNGYVLIGPGNAGSECHSGWSAGESSGLTSSSVPPETKLRAIVCYMAGKVECRCRKQHKFLLEMIHTAAPYLTKW